MRYQLMHKDHICGEMTKVTGSILEYQDNGEGYSPFLGNCDLNNIRRWWAMRSVPASRNVMQEMQRLHKCLSKRPAERMHSSPCIGYAMNGASCIN